MYIELAYPEQQKKIDGTGRLTEATIQYLIFEALDETDALNYAFSEIPKNLENLTLLSVAISERKNENIFLLDVSYGVSSISESSNEDEEDEEPTVNFDCTTGSGHINTAIKPVEVIHGPDVGNIIGWNGKLGDDCEIAGCDIPIATTTETYTKVMSVSKVLSNSFRRKIVELTSCVNSKSFKGWDVGEVMFMGCSYASPIKGASKVTVSFNFAIRVNETVDIRGKKVFVRGWNHLDVITKPKEENGKPDFDLLGIYVAQVSKYKDFGVLELGR